MWKLSATSASEPTAYPGKKGKLMILVWNGGSLTNDELDKKEDNVDY